MVQKRVLVVDDSSETQQLLAELVLEPNDYRPIAALDGEEGFRLALQEHPDLIVLDMQLPKMNGLQVCEALKRGPQTRSIPVIMLTRHDDPQMITLGLKSGIVDYIPKDAFADAVLVETLRQMGLIAASTTRL